MLGTVDLEQVSKRYVLGDSSVINAADNVTLTIAPGTRTALVGSSGSGKSTLLHLIGAIDVPDAGRISVDGQEITGLSRRRLADYRAGIGFVFQQFHLLSALSVVDNVAAPLVNRCPLKESRSRALEMLDAVGLGGRRNSRPDQLSGGQRQRVAIARALVVRPTLILADEPTGNLDSATAAEITDLLAATQEQCGATLIIATHDQHIAQTCDVVMEVRDGRVRSDALSADVRR
jgi:putative ABC transport system ATP-binding protein